MVYDVKTNTILIGTGNGSPWTRAIRSPGGGDNLYLSSIIALDPDTGKMKWYYQETPGDNWDYTSTQPMRSEEHTSELQSLMRISYAVFCLKKKKEDKTNL